jgi:hypothetical protein
MRFPCQVLNYDQVPRIGKSIVNSRFQNVHTIRVCVNVSNHGPGGSENGALTCGKLKYTQPRRRVRCWFRG